MRQHQFLSIICALLLASCGGNASPTPVANVPSNLPTAVPTNVTIPATPAEPIPTTGPREYSDGTQEVVLPETGTIVPPATEDPDSGKLFDSVGMERMGGADGKSLQILLLADGTLTRDGVTSTVNADQVKQISDILDQIGFFGLQGVFQGVGTSPDIYTYYITGERNGARRLLTAQDGFMPPELTNLVQILTALGTAK